MYLSSMAEDEHCEINVFVAGDWALELRHECTTMPASDPLVLRIDGPYGGYGEECLRHPLHVYMCEDVGIVRALSMLRSIYNLRCTEFSSPGGSAWDWDGVFYGVSTIYSNKDFDFGDMYNPTTRTSISYSSMSPKQSSAARSRKSPLGHLSQADTRFPSDSPFLDGTRSPENLYHQTSGSPYAQVDSEMNEDEFHQADVKIMLHPHSPIVQNVYLIWIVKSFVSIAWR